MSATPSPKSQNQITRKSSFRPKRMMSLSGRNVMRSRSPRRRNSLTDRSNGKKKSHSVWTWFMVWQPTTDEPFCKKKKFVGLYTVCTWAKMLTRILYFYRSILINPRKINFQDLLITIKLDWLLRPKRCHRFKKVRIRIQSYVSQGFRSTTTTACLPALVPITKRRKIKVRCGWFERFIIAYYIQRRVPVRWYLLLVNLLIIIIAWRHRWPRTALRAEQLETCPMY